MKHPKVQTVKVFNNHILLIMFDNEQEKKYDVSPLLERDMFAPLKNSALFRSVKVEQGGYAISWSNNIDISEHELWTHGVSIL